MQAMERVLKSALSYCSLFSLLNKKPSFPRKGLLYLQSQLAFRLRTKEMIYLLAFSHFKHLKCSPSFCILNALMPSETPWLFYGVASHETLV